MLIVGASTRAAAASAVRARFSPICFDRFGDEDLRRFAEIVTVSDPLRDSLPAIQSLPPTPWIYTGPVENDPEFIRAICEKHPLMGNPSDILAWVRDPFWLEQTLRAAGIPALKNEPFDRPPPTDGRFLLKPRQSAGGQSILSWRGQVLPTEESYFQERRFGRPLSALFVSNRDKTDLVGVCQQLIGPDFDSPWEFGYAGSIGCVPVSEQLRQSLLQIGELIAERSGLRGLFGCDFIADSNEETPWLIEVNPRYTASVEILERATGRTLLAEHASACGHHMPSLPRATEGSLHNVFGKQIVFAKSDVIASDLTTLFDHEDNPIDQPLIADIPAIGSKIEMGGPICTVFAKARDMASCQAELSRRTKLVHLAIASR